MSFELDTLRRKAENLQLEAEDQGRWNYDLAARLYDDAAGYWEALGGRSMEVGECRRLAQECRRKAEGA